LEYGQSSRTAMLTAEVIIVGGGPAGSSCAWRLRRHGISCLVLDRKPFPREKLCGGWITPQVLDDLELDPSKYPLSLHRVERLQLHLYGLQLPVTSLQYSIRRLELDHWLLRRSGAEVRTHDVKRIERRPNGYLIDGIFTCRWLVGAGGTKCPVYRSLFRTAHPRPHGLQVLALEQEFPYEWTDPDCHLWFFRRGLPGYAWYLPKGNGFVNLGIGAVAEPLKRKNQDIKHHWRAFTRLLDRSGLVPHRAYEPSGYSYYLRGQSDIAQQHNAFVIGDAAGLATRDLCEGIGPAVRSGLAAADTIGGKEAYRPERIAPRTLDRAWLSRLIELGYFR
jgi:flavin-dependent dehydrogenase